MSKSTYNVNIGNLQYSYIRYGLIAYILSLENYEIGDLIHFVDNDGNEISDDNKNVFEIIHIEDNHVGLANNYKIVSIQRLRKRGF